jgi:hypothetical protein
MEKFVWQAYVSSALFKPDSAQLEAEYVRTYKSQVEAEYARTYKSQVEAEYARTYKSRRLSKPRAASNVNIVAVACHSA